MDLAVFGIKLSSFIKAFRKSYDVGNGTYDYMSFLKDTDCASYCAMQQSYENPNNVLNFLITPSLNTIDVVGGKKRKMKGKIRCHHSRRANNQNEKNRSQKNSEQQRFRQKEIK
jgi:hypothetical protein